MILSFLIPVYMLTAPSSGFADSPVQAVTTGPAPNSLPTRWILGASVLGSAVALLLTLLRIFIAVPRIKALLPSAILPTSAEHRAEMTGVLLQECSNQTLRGIVEGIDNVDWQRSFKRLTGASSAQAPLAEDVESLRRCSAGRRVA